MGKGDKKTARGKRVNGSYGKVRKRKKSSTISEVSAKAEKKPAVKKSSAKKTTTKKTTTKKVATKKTATKTSSSKKETTKK